VGDNQWFFSPQIAGIKGKENSVLETTQKEIGKMLKA